VDVHHSGATPATLLGRVSSIDWLFTLALAPLGTIGAGAAIALIGVRATRPVAIRRARSHRRPGFL
jgi:hypothetical protein